MALKDEEYALQRWWREHDQMVQLEQEVARARQDWEASLEDH